MLGACLLIALMSSGCTTSLSEAERAKIVAAYADILMAKSQHMNDSAATFTALDSVAKAHGFGNAAEVRDAIAGLSDKPEELRRLLDSTQRRLERIQNGTDSPAKK